LRKYDAWAQEKRVRLDDYPEIIAAFGAYDRIDNQFNSEPWYWLPSYKKFRQTTRFKALMRELGFYGYWLDSGFPPQCHAVGDDDFVRA
jgi:hypothetical protein